MPVFLCKISTMHRIFSEIAYGMWGMDSRAINGFLPLVFNFIKGTPIAISSEAAEKAHAQSIAVRFAEKHNAIYKVSDYGTYAKPQDAPEGSVAIVSIENAITYNDTECGPAGMKTKASIMASLFTNDNVKAILLEMDTPGGEASAMFHMIAQMNTANKPVVAFVRRMAASAGYGIASASNYIIAESPLSEIGSVGTFVTLIDFTEYYREMGVLIESVYATKSTEKNEDYREALKGNMKPLTESIDTFNTMFLDTVSTNRTGKLTDDNHWHKGKLYFAEEALAIGMIDEIGSFERAVEKALELANQ